jgi:hypothetical protein
MAESVAGEYDTFEPSVGVDPPTPTEPTRWKVRV